MNPKSIKLALLVIFFTLASSDHVIWEQQVDLPFARSDFTATIYKMKVYLFGGCVQDQVGYICPEITNDLTLFDAYANTVSTLAAAPRDRFRHTAQIVNMKLYIIGGRDLEDNLISEVDVYDIENDSWDTPSDYELPSQYQTSDAASFQIDDIIYVAGGYNADYSETLDTFFWLDDGEYFSSSDSSYNMANPRGDLAGLVYNGKGYTFGGHTHVDWQSVDHLEVFDPECHEDISSSVASSCSGPWNTLSGMNSARGDKAFAEYKGKFYAFGGEVLDGEEWFVLDEVEVYDIDNDNWYVEETKMPYKVFRFPSAACDMHGIYLFGGQGEPESATYPLIKSIWRMTYSDAANNLIVQFVLLATSVIMMYLC